MASIDSMSKQEFADFALTQGVTLNVSMTKAEMIEDYNKSLGISTEEAPVVEAPVSADTLFAEAQARNAEEERIASLPADEQVELVQWTIEEAIGILRYAVSRGKNKKPLFQEDKILHLIDEIEESAKL